MRRREFITLLSGTVSWPLAARAQQPDRTRRIGVLMGFAESDPTAQSWVAAFRDALAKLGWCTTATPGALAGESFQLPNA